MTGKLTPERLKSYRDRMSRGLGVSNPELVFEHISALEAELAEVKKFAKIEKERDDACIYALEAQKDAAIKERDEARATVSTNYGKFQQARAEAARLREAIEGLKGITCWCNSEHNFNPAMMVGNHSIPCANVRKALSREGG